ARPLRRALYPRWGEPDAARDSRPDHAPRRPQSAARPPAALERPAACLPIRGPLAPHPPRNAPHGRERAHGPASHVLLERQGRPRARLSLAVAGGGLRGRGEVVSRTGDAVRAARAVSSPPDAVILAVIARAAPERPVLAIDEDRIEGSRGALLEFERVAHFTQL